MITSVRDVREFSCDFEGSLLCSGEPIPCVKCNAKTFVVYETDSGLTLGSSCAGDYEANAARIATSLKKAEALAEYLAGLRKCIEDTEARLAKKVPEMEVTQNATTQRIVVGDVSMPFMGNSDRIPQALRDLMSRTWVRKRVTEEVGCIVTAKEAQTAIRRCDSLKRKLREAVAALGEER